MSHWWTIPLYALVIAALVTIACTLIFGRHAAIDTTRTPPALRAADASDPDAQHWRAFADTVPIIRLNAIAEHAADANTELAEGERS